MPDDAEISALPEATAVDGSFTVVGVQGGVTKKATLAVVQEGVVPVFSRTVELTNAQILALPTTGIEVVPAPAAGKMLWPFLAILRTDFMAGGYTNVDPTTALSVGHDSTAAYDYSALLAWTDPDFSGAALMADETSIFINALVPGGYHTPGGFVWSLAQYLPDDDLEALNLAVKAGNGALGNFTGGNAANTLKVTVLYSIIDV